MVADLSSVVIPTPESYTAVGEPFGEFDLDRYLANCASDQDAERKLLTDAGFQRGLARGWLDAEGTTAVAVFVFEAKSPSAARSLQKGIVRQAQRNDRATEFEVLEAEDATGQTYVEETDDGPQTVHVVSFTRGPRLYSVVTQHAVLETQTETVRQMAGSQGAVAR